MEIPRGGSFTGIALLVDINGFAVMVNHADTDLIAQFTSDVLVGGVGAVEDVGGEVVAFMGDAFLAVLPDVEATVQACFRIAKDLDDQCEYITNAQNKQPNFAPFAPGGPMLKITFESGWFDTARISSRFAGEQRLLVSSAINYASRIASAGAGNRCLFGPLAAPLVQQAGQTVTGPFTHTAKDGTYDYFELDLWDSWASGTRLPGEDSYMG